MLAMPQGAVHEGGRQLAGCIFHLRIEQHAAGTCPVGKHAVRTTSEHGQHFFAASDRIENRNAVLGCTVVARYPYHIVGRRDVQGRQADRRQDALAG